MITINKYIGWDEATQTTCIIVTLKLFGFIQLYYYAKEFAL